MWIDFSSEFFLSTIALCSVVLCYGYLVMSVLPYSGFMAMQLVEGLDEENAGYYAGLITSSFMVGRALSSYHWGKAADIYGRKKVLVVSLVLSAIFSLFFGLSRTFAAAMVWRFLLGLSNGMTGTAAAVVGEIASDETAETRSMGVCLSMYGWSILFSPVFSGILSDPVRQFPSLFQNIHGSHLYHFLDRKPFFLTNALASFVCLCSLGMVLGLVRETLPRARLLRYIPVDIWRAVTDKGWHPHEQNSGDDKVQKVLTSHATGSRYGTIPNSDKGDSKQDNLNGSLSSSLTDEIELPSDVVALAQSDIQSAIRASIRSFPMEEGALMSSYKFRDRLADSLTKRTSLILLERQKRRSVSVDMDRKNYQQAEKEGSSNYNNRPRALSMIAEETTSGQLLGGNQISNQPKMSPTKDMEPLLAEVGDLPMPGNEATLASLWAMKSTRRHFLVLWASIFSMHTLETSIPLFLMSRKGGLALSAIVIGTVISLSGANVKFQYFIYIWLVDKYGLYGSIRVAACLMSPSILLLPLVLVFNQRGSIADLTSNFEAALFHKARDSSQDNTAEQFANTTSNSGSAYTHTPGEHLAGIHFVSETRYGENDTTVEEDEYGNLTWAALIYLTTVLCIVRTMSFSVMSSLVVALNHTVIPRHRGTMNGVSGMGGSIAKAVAPILAGFLVGGCLSSGIFVPWVGTLFLFAVLAFFSGVAAILVFTLLEQEDTTF